MYSMLFSDKGDSEWNTLWCVINDFSVWFVVEYIYSSGNLVMRFFKPVLALTIAINILFLPKNDSINVWNPILLVVSTSTSSVWVYLTDGFSLWLWIREQVNLHTKKPKLTV